MMVVDLISRLQHQGVHLSVSEGRLRVNAPVGVLTPELEARLAAHKNEIIEFLLASGKEHAPLPSAPVRTEHPLSYQQRQLWFLDKLDPLPIYNVPNIVRLKGALDAAALSAALRLVVERHSALRTIFVEVNGEPAQRVLPEFRLELMRCDASAANVFELAQEFSGRPFDLSRDIPVRALLCRLGPEDHLLALVFHHIGCDGWSAQVAARDLMEAYSAILAGRQNPWRTPPAQYVDFVYWQRNAETEDRLLRECEAWRKKLAGLPSLADLPFDYPRPAKQMHRGANAFFTFDPEFTASLSRLAKSQGCTLFMVLLAAFKAMLFRYSGNRDVVIGSPAANRPHEMLEETVGFFANAVVLRTQVHPEQPFARLLQQVRETTIEAYALQSVPFARVVEAAAPERNSSQMPLFQVEFVFQNTPAVHIQLNHLEAETVELPSQVAKFDLSLAMVERGGGLFARFEYDTGLFEPSSIERMAGHYRTLCFAAAANPETPVYQLPLLSLEERAALLDAWNPPEAPEGGNDLVHEIFFRQARRNPDSVAIVFGEQHLTYSAVRSRALRLAEHLRAQGIRTDVPVGLCLRRSSLPFIAMLGILEAGGAYVPLDPGYPRDRLTRMIENAAPPVIVTEEALLPLFEGVQASLVPIDPSGNPMMPGSPPGSDLGTTAVQPSGAAFNSLVYILFTSGSTGQPKGVTLEHHTLVNMVRWYASSFPLSPGDRTLQFASISFDVSFEEAFTCWNTGGTLAVLDEEERLSARRILERLGQWAVDRVIIPVVLLEALAREYNASPTVTPCLRQIITSGSQLQVGEEIRRFCRAMPGCVLHNNYGPAETHAVTREPMGADPDEWPELPSIGRPIDNTRCYVTGERGELLPIGVKGELSIGGLAVGRGYYGLPRLTAGRFVPDPWDRRGGGRLYRTGDLVRWTRNGRLLWLGRIDDMVKVRGLRIELGEIETALRAHPAAGEVAARVWKMGDSGEQLVAYIQPNGAVPMPSERDLRAFLESRLPRAMTPARIVTLDKIPVNLNGKIDRRLLPPPGPLEGGRSAPRTAMQHKIAAIWAEVLGIEPGRIGADDNFFALGGHSLLLTQMTARVEALTGIHLPLRVAFERPTAAEIAEWIEVRDLVRQVQNRNMDAVQNEPSMGEMTI